MMHDNSVKSRITGKLQLCSAYIHTCVLEERASSAAHRTPVTDDWSILVRLACCGEGCVVGV